MLHLSSFLGEGCLLVMILPWRQTVRPPASISFIPFFISYPILIFCFMIRLFSCPTGSEGWLGSWFVSTPTWYRFARSSTGEKWKCPSASKNYIYPQWRLHVIWWLLHVAKYSNIWKYSWPKDEEQLQWLAPFKGCQFCHIMYNIIIFYFSLTDIMFSTLFEKCSNS